jgi:penicillin-binding protein 2
MDYSLTDVVEEVEPVVLDQIELEASTVEAVKAGMRGVVTEDGTASSVFRDFPIEVGGKTGSAQTRSGRSAHGVFVSFAPYDEPEIAVCVVGEHAGSGGSVAPVCVAIYNEYFGLNEIADPGDLAEGGAVHN